MRTTKVTAQSAIASLLCIALVSSSASAQLPPPPPPPAMPAAVPPPDGSKPLSESLTGWAKNDYDAGKLLFIDHDFAGALVKFQSAYDKSKDARLFWNLAACEKNLRHYAKTLAYLERYRTEGAPLLKPAEKTEADELIKNIQPFVATVKLQVNEAGADIYVDEDFVGPTPLAKPLLVDIGQRRIKVAKEGFREYVTTLTVSGAGDVLVDVKLEKMVHEGRVVVQAGPSDTIMIDGRNVAMGRFESSLPSGGHQLRVTAPGMQPYQTEVVVQDNQTRTVDVTLEHEKTSGGGVPLWIWITGGAVAVAGLAVGGYFLFKPKDETTPPATGTMQPGTVQLPILR